MELFKFQFDDDGQFPNSSLPVVIYKGFFSGGEAVRPDAYERLLDTNGWGGGWRNGLFSYHHFHSTAHEALCVYKGWADVRLGGEGGKTLRVEAGDVIILPAGVAHKNMGQGAGFSVVGSYPTGQHPDMNYGRPGERPGVDENIAAVRLPVADPVSGSGGIIEYWADKA
ncbi:MAG: cupin domain-containing protein [Spirochaetales bacterium]|uniref:Cupin domain-containing protein n=1 Tax=Candidatus Thalassospirochaeta sargassi TaxID=3119039 RepID=A0AAJ1IEW0_9SPIO|nr:cupin domain-containing protein [Spirochaetales bacterium]